jgi:trans-2,3-dihydro-3-hydroxyanthranilate isomerase
MTQLRPAFGEPLAPEAVLAAFGLGPDDADPALPVCVVSTGTPQLMVPVREASVLERVAHDGVAHAALAEAHAFFSTHVFAVGGVAGGDTVARHFAPGPRGFEDPFTGSATGSMAALLFRHGRLGPRFVAEQGHALGRPGRAEVEVVGPSDAIEAVRVGGAAVTVLRGELEL